MFFYSFFIFLMLIEAQNLYEVSENFQFLYYIVIALMVFDLMIKRSFKVIQLYKESLSFTFLIIVTIVMLLRSNIPDLGQFSRIGRPILLVLFLTVFYNLVLFFLKKGNDFITIITYLLVLPFLLFAAANIALWFANFKPGVLAYSGNAVGEAVILSYMGIHIERVQFPLITGLNIMATFSGMMLLASLLLFFIIKRHRKINMIAIVLFSMVLLMIDSRAAIMYPLLIFAFLFAIKNRPSIPFIRIYAFIPIIGSILIFTALPLLAQVDFFVSLSRTSEDLQTGNSRFFIWGICLVTFANFLPIHTIGYGEYGHYASGASLKWAKLFTDWSNTETATAHNTVLQLIFDIGYVGVIAYFIMFAQLFKRIGKHWSSRRDTSLIYLGVFIYNGLISVTESTYSFGLRDYLYIILFLAIIEIIESRKLETLTTG